MVDLSKPEEKAAFQEVVSSAIEAWLDKQYDKFLRWSARGIAAGVFAAVITWLANHGLLDFKH